jgi:hypothetical protein
LTNWDSAIQFLVIFSINFEFKKIEEGRMVMVTLREILEMIKFFYDLEEKIFVASEEILRKYDFLSHSPAFIGKGDILQIYFLGQLRNTNMRLVG